LSFPVASVPHEKTPVDELFTSQFAAFSAETVRFVVDAVSKYPVPETESAVVDAYGATSDEPENERNGDEVNWPPVVANGIRPERSDESVKPEVDA
jgi:hypothetical protein